MTKIYSLLIVSYLDNENHVALFERFGFHSDVLEKLGLKSDIWAEPGFVFDFESIPNLIRGPIGENKRGGAGHDIVCRKNVCPGITKSIAADVYVEVMTYCDHINQEEWEKKYPNIPKDLVTFLKDVFENYKISIPYIIIKSIKVRDWARRWAKSTVVRYCPSSVFWQKYELTSTAEEIYGTEGDPYVSVEKLDALIEKTEKVSKDLKDVDVKGDHTEEMVKKTDEVTNDLKDEKKEVTR
jgi:hypothetical protein